MLNKKRLTEELKKELLKIPTVEESDFKDFTILKDAKVKNVKMKSLLEYFRKDVYRRLAYNKRVLHIGEPCVLIFDKSSCHYVFYVHSKHDNYYVLTNKLYKVCVPMYGALPFELNKLGECYADLFGTGCR